MAGNRAKDFETPKDQQWIRHLKPVEITKKRYAAWASIWGIVYLGAGAAVILAPHMPWPLGLVAVAIGIIHFGAAIAAARSSPAFDAVFPGLNYADPLRIVIWFFEHALRRTGDPADPTSNMGPETVIPRSSGIKKVLYTDDRAIIIREPARTKKWQHNLAVGIALGAGVILSATGLFMSLALTGDWILLGGFFLVFGLTFAGIGAWGFFAGLSGQGYQLDLGATDLMKPDHKEPA